MADRFSADHRALRSGDDMGVGVLRGVNALRDLVHLRLDCPLIGKLWRLGANVGASFGAGSGPSSLHQIRGRPY